MRYWRTIPALLALLALPAAGQDNMWGDIDALNEAKDFAASGRLLMEIAAQQEGSADYRWRMARYHFNLSDNASDEAVIAENIYAGLEFARQSLAADSNSAGAHGYYGILIGRAGEIEGTKQKIINSYEVGDHTLKAIEIAPQEDTWQHVMGRWNYTLADLSCIERTIASIVYASPPKASFVDAEGYFRAAARLAPDDVRHPVWLAKTLRELDQDEQAKSALEAALALPAKSESDRMLQAEARELLEDL